MKGIIPRSFNHVVNIIESTNDRKFLVRCSYIEIYNEEVHDLLGKGILLLLSRCKVKNGTERIKWKRSVHKGFDNDSS